MRTQGCLMESARILNLLPREQQPLKFDLLRQGRDVIQSEADALHRLARQIPDTFFDAVQMIDQCQGAVIVTGVGKAGWIGQKISATFASLGTPSHFLSPSEAYHGDLGRIGPRDLVLALSNSGETSELLQILPRLNQFSVPIIALTSNSNSTLGRLSTIVLDYGRFDEACFLGLAPTTTTTAMLALGDALALVVARNQNFQRQDFARFHPGGNLGKLLSLVDDVMRPLSECRLAMRNESVREIYVRHGGKTRRVGVILVLDDQGRLAGLFTDSDLARLLERQQDNFFDGAISDVMTADPVTVRSGTKTKVAVEMLACRSLSELPVVDPQHRPIGLLDITDVVSLIPTRQ
jgi:arabinose-5-phosphate isomerase